jgi:spore coat protein U-like protein
MKRKVVALVCLAAFSAPHGAFAFQKRAVPRPSDFIPAAGVSAVPINFGSVIAGDSADGTGSITVSAPSGSIVRIGLDNGLNRVGGGRGMRLSSNLGGIPYAVYSDAGYSMPWGDNGLSNSNPVVVRALSDQPLTLPVYARMRTGRGDPVGNYTDTIMITVTY